MRYKYTMFEHVVITACQNCYKTAYPYNRVYYLQHDVFEKEIC